MTDRPQTDPGQPVDSRRLSVRQAADLLDTTPDAIRARIRRGTLQGEKVGAEWIVILTSAPPVTEGGQSRQTPGQSETVGQSVGDRRGQTPDSLATAALLAHLQDEIAYLRDLVRDRDRALEERSRELAAERERSDVLQQLALSRIPAVTAGTVQEPPSDASERPGAPFETPAADDSFMANGAAETPSGLTDVLAAQWSDLTEQLIAELAMDPEAALIAAAADLGIPYGDGSVAS